MSRSYELAVVSYFIDWLNSHNFDYFVVNNEEEASEIDVLAKSKSTENILKFQVRTSNHQIIQHAQLNAKNFKKGLGLIVGDVKPEEWVTDSINYKEHKYPKDLKQELILLISGFLPTPERFIVENFSKKFINSDFKGIYYVSLPTISYPKRPETDNGYVICLKAI